MRKISHVLCHPHITSRHSRVTHAICCAIYFVSFCYPCRAVSLLMLFLRRASRHALFSINAVPLRDTSRVSCVTLCRFRGISSYIGVISCLVTSVRRAILLCVVPVRRSPRSFLVPPLRVSLLPYLIHIVTYRHTLYEENVLYSLKMKLYRHERRAKKLINRLELKIFVWNKYIAFYQKKVITFAANLKYI